MCGGFFSSKTGETMRTIGIIEDEAEPKEPNEGKAKDAPKDGDKSKDGAGKK